MEATQEAIAVRVPPVARFEANGTDFLNAPELEAVARAVIRRWPELEWLDQWRVRVFWKRKGGAKGGHATLGKMQVASGLIKHLAETDFVVWVAAEHCRQLELDAIQIEAIVYHELLHCDVNESEDDEVEPTPASKGHDLEVFYKEIERYGDWKPDIAAAHRQFDQSHLPGFAPEGVDEETGEIRAAVLA